MAKAIMKNNKIYEEVMSFLNTGKRKKPQGRETVQGLRDILFTASALRGLNMSTEQVAQQYGKNR